MFAYCRVVQDSLLIFSPLVSNKEVKILTLFLDNSIGEKRKERMGKGGEGKEGKRNKKECLF